jgi:hypothetical protein
VFRLGYITSLTCIFSNSFSYILYNIEGFPKKEHTFSIKKFRISGLSICISFTLNCSVYQHREWFKSLWNFLKTFCEVQKYESRQLNLYNTAVQRWLWKKFAMWNIILEYCILYISLSHTHIKWPNLNFNSSLESLSGTWKGHIGQKYIVHWQAHDNFDVNNNSLT